MRRIALLALIQLVFLAACGGGSSNDFTSGSGSGGGTQPTGNTAQLTLDGGPDPSAVSAFNTPYVTIMVCAPGSTTNCQTIDHIEVDTASYGLRIISSVLNSTLLAALPQETSSGAPIAECTLFGDGYSWGSMRTADMEIAGEKASSIPMQVIGDPSVPNVPTACSTASVGGQEDSVDTFGANGIIGVGPFAQDCGETCEESTQAGFYYSCPAGATTCGPIEVTLGQQATNPVAAFATDNNGVIVELPAIADAGAMQVSGTLVFGIGTQSNNSLGSAVVLTTDPNTGNLSVNFAGNTYTDSFIDSGSNLLFFDLNSSSTVSIPQCTIKNTDGTSESFYCPSSEQALTAVISGQNGTQSNVTFNVANAQTIFDNEPSFAAFDNVAAPDSFDTQSGNTDLSFDFGIPFFFGRNVFTAIDGTNTPGGMGPYIAY